MRLAAICGLIVPNNDLTCPIDCKDFVLRTRVTPRREFPRNRALITCSNRSRSLPRLSAELTALLPPCRSSDTRRRIRSASTSARLVKTIWLASLKLWPQWLAELPEPIFYQNNGTLVLAHAGDRSDMSRFRIRAQHSLNSDDFSLLNQQQLAEKEPDLADKFDQSLFSFELQKITLRQIVIVFYKFIARSLYL